MSVLGMWVWQQNVLQRGAKEVVSRCEKAGVTDLFFLVKGLNGVSAWHGKHVPHSCERDLLREVTDAAHHHNMRVHAWFTSACDAHYKALYPESGRCHYTRGKDRELISLADEAYLAYMTEAVAEVCQNYEVDGLHLDYIRYNHLMYGWAKEDLKRYEAEGADPEILKKMLEQTFPDGEAKGENDLFAAYHAGDKNAHALARARRKDVMHFASSLAAAARAQKFHLILSAALMPEGAYEDCAFADLHYGQNYKDASSLFEYALPMAYSLAYQKDAAWVKQVAEGTERHGMKTIVGLQAYGEGTGLTLQADLEAALQSSAEGVCLFREGATALARVDEKRLYLYNALDEEITCIKACAAQQEWAENVSIASGAETSFAFPFQPEVVRVFAGGKERCVYIKPTA